MPASSKTDPRLAKAEPISDSSSASGIMYLRGGKKTSVQHQLQRERGVRICERNNFADTEVNEEGGRGGAPGTRAEIPLQPMVRTMVRQEPSAAHGGPQWSRYPPAAHGGPHARAEAVTPWEAYAGAGSWQEVWARGERSPCWSRFDGRTCDHMADSHWSSLFLKDCILWKDPR
ncbi:suppression of tumorigenicity 5 protein isoform x4 [Limosa lapponica baueri]|uniref:Suppression of tumorigenicity 5 protein isoform x4 n=1 Tax=Limosa lapponica baueri TaxID=1758121 RepID=A0A2I0URM2_LIMLA|nr:suppression of tumorigenicity 5 protein isoform x4 [Limosa lapponica baueri]